MKRLVLLLVLVVALSGTAMAGSGNWVLNPNALSKPNKIDIEVNVSKFAYIDYLDTSAMLFNLEAPTHTAENPRQERQLRFATNTPVYVELEETISQALRNGITGTDSDDFLKVLLSIKDRKGQDGKYAFDAGSYDVVVQLAIGWNYGAGNDPAFDSRDWWALKDGKYEGDLTITISAQ